MVQISWYDLEENWDLTNKILTWSNVDEPDILKDDVLFNYSSKL